MEKRDMMKDSTRTMWASIDTGTSPSQYADHDTCSSSNGMWLLQRAAIGLLPSFIQRKVRPGHSKVQRLHPTSYLDGLRGAASFIVFVGHYTEENIGWFTEPYGAYEDGAPSSPLQLPFVRVIYSARPMVHIFLIISGFVLSYKPLKQIHSHQYSALITTLSSSVFRRSVRLFVPSFVGIWIMGLAVFYGVSDARFASREATLSLQLSSVWETCLQMLQSSWTINTLSPYAPTYNPALWTIPVEFSQSMFLFVAVLGLSRCLTHVRLFLVACLTAFCLYSGQLYTAEFIGGVFLAEITLLQDRSPGSPTSSPHKQALPIFEELSGPEDCGTSVRQRLVEAFWIANVVCGLFIASWTNFHIEELWGIRYLDAHTPAPYSGQRLWFGLAAFQIVAACSQVAFLQRIFTTDITQYLGNISYALYLMHNLCLTVLEPRFNPLFDQLFNRATFWGRHMAWAAGLAIYGPVVVCVADLFWRLVDTPTVKFARWIEAKCVVEKKL